MKKGKFIVIDGTDGSGKATQVQMLFDRLVKEKKKVKKIDFPQYEDNFFGKLIRECLRGDYGDFISINPKIASVLYAADRWESSEKIKSWIKKGYIVIADRYVSSNQIHQAGKIKENKERESFLKWLDVMEFDVFKIPRPDAIMFLNVPIEVTLKLMNERRGKEDNKGKHKGEKDLAEENEKHLNESRESGLEIIKKNNNWKKIDCTKNGELMTREDIHQKVYEIFKKIINK